MKRMTREGQASLQAFCRLTGIMALEAKGKKIPDGERASNCCQNPLMTHLPTVMKMTEDDMTNAARDLNERLDDSFATERRIRTITKESLQEFAAFMAADANKTGSIQLRGFLPAVFKTAKRLIKHSPQSFVGKAINIVSALGQSLRVPEDSEWCAPAWADAVATDITACAAELASFLMRDAFPAHEAVVQRLMSKASGSSPDGVLRELIIGQLRSPYPAVRLHLLHIMEYAARNLFHAFC